MTASTMTERFFILTGAMGAGKSTLIKLLRSASITCVDEPARAVLAQQRAIDAGGVPEHDSNLFCQLLLSHSIALYQQQLKSPGPVVFDRGILDNLQYARYFNLDTKPFENAANLYRCNAQVFFLEGWQDIYTTDDERKMSFEEAASFGDALKSSYLEHGYELTIVPRLSANERASFIRDRLP